MSQIKKTSLIVFVILSLGYIFHHKYINEFPSHIHAWAECDRYALSLGFVNNNLNFFKPETFVMNFPFPDDWKVPKNESITAVNFPLHDYIPAILMKITGIKSPFIFRTYILLYSLIGLFFIYKLSHLICKSNYKSIFVTIFAATSPIFVYYQGGFLPSIPSLANATIGIYFLAKYLYHKKNIHFNLCLLFLTIATLCRTTFAVLLIAILGLEFLRILRKESKLKHQIIPIVISISTILLYYFYNIYLRTSYGSLFLHHLLPAENIQHIINILKTTIKKWGDQYFSQVHYIIFSLLFLVAFFLQFNKNQKRPKQIIEIRLLLFIIFIGYSIFSLLMIRQFPNHDYYFLDTFYLPLIILLILLINIIPESKNRINKIIYATIISLLSIPMILNAYNTQSSRRENKDSKVIAFDDADQLLASLSIPNDAKLLAIDFRSPNIPFTLMNRKGYTTMSYKKNDIKNALDWNFDYIVMDNEIFLSQIYTTYPELINKLHRVGTNGKISVYTLSKKVKKNQTILEFLDLKNKSPRFQALMNYDEINGNEWSNIRKTSNHYYSGKHSGIVGADMEYGLSYKTNKMAELTKGIRTLVFSSYFFKDKEQINNCEVVVSINEDGKSVYYKSYDLQKQLKKINKWEKVDLMFQLPQIKSNDYEFAIYLWNRGKTNLGIDDFGFKLF